MKIIKILLPFLVLVVMMTLPSIAFAQGPGDPGCSPDDPCPIDGGLSLLIAAGVGIAAKRAHSQKKKAVAQAD